MSRRHQHCPQKPAEHRRDGQGLAIPQDEELPRGRLVPGSQEDERSALRLRLGRRRAPTVRGKQDGALAGRKPIG
jgi:hypothetical protein